MNRTDDLTSSRKPVGHDSPWSAYWATHAPDAHDLAKLFKVSPRRVRELWLEGWLTKGGCLARAVNEWVAYQVEVRGSDGHVGGRNSRRG